MSNPHVFYRLGFISEDTAENIFDEAIAAHEKHGPNSMLYGSDEKSLRILLEEVGECAREMNELNLGNRTSSEYDQRLYEEMVQVSAMALTWAEKIRQRQGK